jgi:hypothetical protein
VNLRISHFINTRADAMRIDCRSGHSKPEVKGDILDPIASAKGNLRFRNLDAIYSIAENNLAGRTHGDAPE